MANLTQSKQPPQTRPPHTNTWATLSLICGVLSFSLFSAPLAILAGLIALYQIKRTGDEGRGQAIAGILLGVFVPLVLMVAFVIAYGIGESLSGNSESSICAKVSTHLAETAEPALVQVHGYQYANVPGPNEEGHTLGEEAYGWAQMFTEFQNNAIPGVISGFSAHYVLTVPPGTPALQTVCSDDPPVLLEFRLGSATPPGLQYWTNRVGAFRAMTPSASVTSVAGVPVAAMQEPQDDGGFQFHYVWVDRGNLLWAHGGNQQTVEHFVEALIDAS